MKVERPFPPKFLIDSFEDEFAPAPELDDFVCSTFLNDKHPLFNEEHLHLSFATIGYLWTNVANSRHQKGIAGQAEIPFCQGGKWAKAIYNWQNRQWFGTDRLDFRIILDAKICDRLLPIEFCALLEHELYHCAQSLDDFGAPKFSKDGRPKFGLRGHDLEEFVGIIQRYGVGAGAAGSLSFARAIKQKPKFTGVEIQMMCGTCLGLRA